MGQREAKGSAIHFCNCKYFSLAERVEYKAEERSSSAEEVSLQMGRVTHQGTSSQAKDFDLF